MSGRRFLVGVIHGRSFDCHGAAPTLLVPQYPPVPHLPAGPRHRYPHWFYERVLPSDRWLAQAQSSGVEVWVVGRAAGSQLRQIPLYGPEIEGKSLDVPPVGVT